MVIRVKTDNSELYNLLNDDMPDGVEIISFPPCKTYTVDVVVNINIDIAINLSIIVIPLVSAWLVKKLVSQKGNHKISFDGKQVAINQAKIEEELQKAIDCNESE